MSAPTPQCDAVLDALGRGSLPPELQAHADTCPHCRSTRAAHAALARLGATPRSEALKRAHALASAELRAHPLGRRWWWGALGLVALNLAVGVGSALMLLAPGISSHAPRAPSPAMWAIALLLLGLLVAGPLISFSPPRPNALGAGLLLATAAALGVALGGSGGVDSRAFALPGLGCAGAEVVLSLLPFAVTLAALRRIPAHPLRTLLACLSAAAAGLLGLHLSCPVGTVAHLFGFHVLPWLALGVIALQLRPHLRTHAYAP